MAATKRFISVCTPQITHPNASPSVFFISNNISTKLIAIGYAPIPPFVVEKANAPATNAISTAEKERELVTSMLFFST